MEWEFTPQQVVKGETDYGLDAFRRDLMREVALNMPGIDNARLQRAFSLAYDLCYWLATGRDYGEFEDHFEDLGTLMFLRALREHGKANVDMLGAILQRMIMDGVEAGLSLDGAMAQAALHQKEAASRLPA